MLRRRDPYRVGRDLEWLGALVAAVVLIGLFAYLLITYLNIGD